MPAFVIHTEANNQETAYEVEAYNYGVEGDFVVFRTGTKSDPPVLAIKTARVVRVVTKPEAK